MRCHIAQYSEMFPNEFSCLTHNGFIQVTICGICRAFGLDPVTATTEQLRSLIGKEFDAELMTYTYMASSNAEIAQKNIWTFKEEGCSECNSRYCNCEKG